MATNKPIIRQMSAAQPCLMVAITLLLIAKSSAYDVSLGIQQADRDSSLTPPGDTSDDLTQMSPWGIRRHIPASLIRQYIQEGKRQSRFRGDLGKRSEDLDGSIYEDPFHLDRVERIFRGDLGKRMSRFRGDLGKRSALEESTKRQRFRGDLGKRSTSGELNGAEGDLSKFDEFLFKENEEQNNE